ncbi:MAG TPA: glycosyltransferase family 9 protein [Blastocatellia bacterium]|jgi:ADP-heptose:LPS heptosyltransferase
MSYQPRSILVADVSSFGRSLFLLPAIRALRAAYPKTFIAVATEVGACELLAATGLVDEAIDLGIIKASDDGSYAGVLKRAARLFRRARHIHFDLVIDFSPRLETQVLFRFVVRARTVTPSRMPHLIEALIGARARRPRGEAGDYEEVLRQLGIAMGDARFAIRLPDEEHTQFEQVLSKRGSRGGEPIVVLYAANSASPLGWPVEAFGEIASRLAHNFGARLVAADEPSDESFTQALGALLPQTAIKLAAPSALQLTAAIARASLVITDERGLALVATEMGTPVIEISDDSSARQSSKAHRVVRGSSRPRVTTDEVYEVACEMLQCSRSTSLFQR